MSLRVPSWLKKEASILGVALALRLVVALAVPMPAGFESLSEPGVIAANLVAGRGYSFDFYGARPDNPLLAFLPPLHPLLIALALRFGRPNLALGVMQAFLGALGVGLLTRLATRLAGRRVGLMAGWMGAFYPAHVLVTSQPISVALFSCCMLAVLLAFYRLQERPSAGRALVAGSLIGIYALGRSQVLLLIPLLFGWLWLNDVRGRPLVQSLLLVVAAASLVLLPWMLRNGLVMGWFSPTSTNGGVTFWNGNNPFTTGSGHDVFADRLAAYEGRERDPNLPDLYEHPGPYPVPPQIEAQMDTVSEPALSRAFWRAGWDYIRGQPAGWLELELRKLVSFWWFRPNLGANPLYRAHWTTLYRWQYGITLLVACVGVTLALRGGLARQSAILLVVLGYTCLVQIIFHVLTRYRWEVELLLLVFVALALEYGRRAGQRLVEKRG